MKAIQIKYLPCTNTKLQRLKAWTKSGELIIELFDHAGGIEAQAFELAQRYLDKMRDEAYWNISTRITGFGCLPNGDYVATLGE